MVWNFRMQWKRTWAPTEVCVGILSDPEYCLGLEMVRCQINMNWLSDSSNEAWSVYFLFLEVVAFFWIPQLLIHTVDGNTLHIQYDRTRLDIAMRHSDFPASGAKSQSHARPSWSKAIEHLECGGCLSLDPTGAGQQIHGCWGRIHQVEPRDVGESQFWRALRNVFFVMLELGKLTHPSGDMFVPAALNYCGRFGSCDSCAKAIIAEGWVDHKISQIHLKSKVGQKFRHWKTHSPGTPRLPGD